MTKGQCGYRLRRREFSAGWVLAGLTLALGVVPGTNEAKEQSAPTNGTDQSLVPEALLKLGILEMKRENWKAALKRFAKINKLHGHTELRARANFLTGVCLENQQDPKAAMLAFLNTWNAYPRFETTTAEAFEKWLNLGLKDAENLSTKTEIRAKKIEYYTFLKVKLFQWQRWNFEAPENEALRRLRSQLPALRKELAITAEEEAAIDAKLGINQKD